MTSAESTSDGTWFEVAPLVDLPLIEGREFIHHGQSIALFRLADRVAALGGLCPHQRAHLADGLVDPDNRTVTCPRRGCLRWRFDLANGTQTAGPPVACPVDPVAIRAGVVFVEVPD